MHAKFESTVQFSKGTVFLKDDWYNIDVTLLPFSTDQFLRDCL